MINKITLKRIHTVYTDTLNIQFTITFGGLHLFQVSSVEPNKIQ